MAVAKGVKLHYCGHGKHGQRPAGDEALGDRGRGRGPEVAAGGGSGGEDGDGRLAAADCIRDQIGVKGCGYDMCLKGGVDRISVKGYTLHLFIRRIESSNACHSLQL